MKARNRIYLDYAAATPLDSRVAEVMAEAQQVYANPSTLYTEGRVARVAYQDAKKRIAMVLGVRAGEIMLTSGATESDNLAILGAVRPHLAQNAHIVTIPTEHKSVLEPIAQLEHEGASVSMARVDHNGVVDLVDLERAIGESTVLVSIAVASSEIGTIQPMAKIGQLITKIKKNRVERGITTPLLLHSDASAAAGLLPLSPARLSADLLTLNPSKFYGPRSVGILHVKSGTQLSPIIYGGGQQGGLRPGREDVASALGAAMAFELSEQARQIEAARLALLRDELLRGLAQALPSHLLNGHPTRRLANHVSICLPGLNGEDIQARLDARGFAVATGAACEATSDAPSTAILALGRSQTEAQGSLRITLGRDTTAEHIASFIDALKQVVQDLATL